MDDPSNEELRRRVEALEREKRRWRVTGVISLTLLGLVLCLGCPLTAGTALLRARHVRQLQAERDAAERARRAAAEDRAEAERRAAEARKKEEAARPAAEKEAPQVGEQPEKPRGSEK